VKKKFDVLYMSHKLKLNIFIIMKVDSFPYKQLL